MNLNPPLHSGDCPHQSRKVTAVAGDIACMRCPNCGSRWTTFAIRMVLEKYR